MGIAKTYNPNDVEDKWYAHWMAKRYFHSEPDEREPFTIVIPPPNVTGVLHMGHILNNTLQDIMIRRARMQGKNACWVPGTDHASIATEAKVVRMLRQKGIKKSDLSREEFMEHAWEWTHKHGGIILEQLKKLGASCDWDRTRFTMEDDMSEAVISVFIDLYKKGYIKRGLRMINWDPEAKTALSNEEVIHKDVVSKLFHVRYKVEGTEDEWVTIATTRPETILGDSAICFHPDDARYKHMSGKKILVPLIERPVPAIFDTYIDMEFGTGALKVTPAHDLNDYEIGKKNDLEVIDILNPDGTMSEAALLYVGEDRFEVRKKIVKELEEKGHLVKVEEFKNSVGYSERTDVVIEPRLSLQWFLEMDKLAKPALDNVMNDNINLIPSKYKNTYHHWMSNIREWCVSRQLWWGQRIPAYYFGEDEYVVATSQEEALEAARKKSGNKELQASDLRQDEDVLDTWASSWLWPISVFNGFKDPDNKEINYYYPTNVLVTAPEILFFWVARMVMAGYEYRGEKPFSDVYLTGIVRDKLRRKMSKSLGNSPEPLDMIREYGADGVRSGMLFCSPAGNDILFDDKLVEQGRNFSNKIWNALRLIKGWEIKEGSNPENEIAIEWFQNGFNKALKNLDDSFDTYRFSEGLKDIYSFVWNDFCSWYLEFIKPAFGEAIDRATLERTIDFFEDVVKVLHPVMPFITEEIYHQLRDRKDGDDVIIAEWPKQKSYDKELLRQGEFAKEIISTVRDIRKKNSIPYKESLDLYVDGHHLGEFNLFINLIKKMAVLDKFDETDSEIPGALSFIVAKNKFYLPAGDAIDQEAEIERVEKDLAYNRGFLISIDKKLSNERFVQNAPADVIEKERKKQADARDKIRLLEESLARLKK